MLIQTIYYFSDSFFNIEGLVNSLFGVKIFNPFSFFTSFSSSSGGMGGTLSDFLFSSSSLSPENQSSYAYIYIHTYIYIYIIYIYIYIYIYICYRKKSEYGGCNRFLQDCMI